MEIEDLPGSVQEIAEVIGAEQAVRLINSLPTCVAGVKDHKSVRPILYVPKKLAPDHRLVQILGWHDANKLVRTFGGEILYPANCRDLHKSIRDRYVRELLDLGYKADLVGDLIGMSPRNVRNIAGEAKPFNEQSRGE